MYFNHNLSLLLKADSVAKMQNQDPYSRISRRIRVFRIFWVPEGALLPCDYNILFNYRCKKTYEANECGRTLDALTDLTGGVCEFFTPDINPPENLFHVLYKSCVNRSQIVCWRNDKLLTPTGFKLIRQDSVKLSVSNKKYSY